MSGPTIRASRPLWGRPYRAAPGCRIADAGGCRSTLDDGLRVADRVQQVLHLSWVGKLDLDHPAIAVRVAVDQLRGTVQRVVAGHHGAADRGEDVRHRLGGLDLPDGIAELDGRPRLRQLDEDDVTQGVLCVVGDADPGDRDAPGVLRGGLAVQGADPLVVRAVTQILWDHDEALSMGFTGLGERRAASAAAARRR